MYSKVARFEYKKSTGGHNAFKKKITPLQIQVGRKKKTTKYYYFTLIV